MCNIHKWTLILSDETNKKKQAFIDIKKEIPSKPSYVCDDDLYLACFSHNNLTVNSYDLKFHVRE